LVLIAYKRSLPIREAGQHADSDAMQHRKADGTGLEHLGARGGELEHLLIRNLIKLPRLRNDSRIRREPAFHIGLAVAAIGVRRGGQRTGPRIRAAASERSDALIRAKTLEARNDGDLSILEAPLDLARVDLDNARGGMGVVSTDGNLPALPGP